MRNMCLLSGLFLATGLFAGRTSPERVSEAIARKQAHLPESWLYLSDTSSEVATLPKGMQDALAELRADAQREHASRYFTVFGEYTPEMQSRIEAMNRACTEAYMVSTNKLSSDLTPELTSVSESSADIWWDDQIIYNIQGRELHDDWRSFWLMDSPSTLNRHPIIDTSVP